MVRVEQFHTEAGPSEVRPQSAADLVPRSAKFEAALALWEQVDPKLARAFAQRVRAATEIPGHYAEIQFRVSAQQVNIRVEFRGQGPEEKSDPIVQDLAGDGTARVTGLEEGAIFDINADTRSGSGSMGRTYSGPLGLKSAGFRRFAPMERGGPMRLDKNYDA